MSTFVLMRVLESAPQRYDAGMRLITLGRLDAAYDRLAGRVRVGERVLDLGCGTGALTLRAACRGARVLGVDVDAGMLAIAARRVAAAGLEDRVELREAGVAELGREADGSYHAVLAGLFLSELGPDERRHALREAARLLRPGGLLLLADEVRAAGRARRLLLGALRAPLVLLAWLATQQSTHPLQDPEAMVRAAGLAPESVRRSALGSLVELVAAKAGGGR